MIYGIKKFEVRDLLSQCKCKQTFPMVRIGEGRYLFGDKSTQIFVRILRSHVMVRVGGGWDTLNHFLEKYDECRKTNPINSHVSLNSVNEPKTIDTNDKNQLIHAVKESTPPNMSNGPFIGQGNLSVVKKLHSTFPDAASVEQSSCASKCCSNPNESDLSNNQKQPKSISSQSGPSTPIKLRKTFVSRSQNDLSNAHRTISEAHLTPKSNKICTIDIPEGTTKSKFSNAITAPTSPTGSTSPFIKSSLTKPLHKESIQSSRTNKSANISSASKSNQQKPGNLRRRKSETTLSMRKTSLPIDRIKSQTGGEDKLVFIPYKSTGPKPMNPNLSKSVGSLHNRIRTRTANTNCQSPTSNQLNNQVPKIEIKSNNVRQNSVTPPTLKPLNKIPLSSQIRDRFARSPSYDCKNGRCSNISSQSSFDKSSQKRLEQPLFGQLPKRSPCSEIPSSSTSTTVSLSGSQDPLCDKNLSTKPRRSSLIPLPIRSHSSSRIPIPLYLNTSIAKVPEI